MTIERSIESAIARLHNNKLSSSANRLQLLKDFYVFGNNIEDFIFLNISMDQISRDINYAIIQFCNEEPDDKKTSIMITLMRFQMKLLANKQQYLNQ